MLIKIHLCCHCQQSTTHLSPSPPQNFEFCTVSSIEQQYATWSSPDINHQLQKCQRKGGE